MPERDCAAGLCETTGMFSKALIHMRHDYMSNYRIPIWGVTRSLHIKNAGYVIGFAAANGDRWRLDYDDDKKIHINWEPHSHVADKICHKLQSSFSPFDCQAVTGLVVPPEIKHKKNKGKPQVWVQIMWWSWTKSIMAVTPPSEEKQGQIAAKYQDTYTSYNAFQTAVVNSSSYEDIKSHFA